MGFAAITIIGSRIMVSKQKSSLAIQEYRVETKAIDNKVQSAVLVQGLGKHLLDLLK